MTEATQKLNTAIFSGALRAKYDINHAAGRLITDDGDEHGCPTQGRGAGCRVNPKVEPMTATEIAEDFLAHPAEWTPARTKALSPELRLRVREEIDRLKKCG